RTFRVVALDVILLLSLFTLVLESLNFLLLCFSLSHLLFFPSHCPPRYLHSFPTRRSSDLIAAWSWYGPDRRSAAARCRTTNADPDRKSTRLNSSHQIISYAVFCLKKKKK